MALREKQRVIVDENENLKARLRLFENDLIASGSKRTVVEEQMKKYIEQAQRQSSQIEDLSGKVNSNQQVGLVQMLFENGKIKLFLAERSTQIGGFV